MTMEGYEEGEDFVRCELCGECMRDLTAHIRDVHRVSMKRYREIFPGSAVVSGQTRARRLEARSNRNGAAGRRYAKRVAYLMPDGTYAARADAYMKAWGTDSVRPEHVADAKAVGYVPARERLAALGKEGEDYVTCAVCGERKGSLTQHLRKAHGMTAAEYEARYGAPVHSRRNAEAFHQCAVRKWRTQFETGASRPSPRRRGGNAGTSGSAD